MKTKLQAAFILHGNKVLWSPYVEHHEGIIERYCLDEARVVKVYMAPPDGKPNAPLHEWQYIEPTVAPPWYNPTKAKTKVRKALREWAAEKLIKGGKRTIYGPRQVYVLGGEVIGFDSAKIYLFKGKAWGYGRTSIEACGGKVFAHGKTTVFAHGRAEVEAYELARTDVFDSCKLVCGDFTYNNIRGNVKVKAEGYAFVLAPPTAKVELSGRATCRLLTEDK